MVGGVSQTLYYFGSINIDIIVHLHDVFNIWHEN